MAACPVCFADDGGEDEPRHLARLQGCRHRVCLPCLKTWFETCEGKRMASPTCPECREPVKHDEIVEILGRPYCPADSGSSNAPAAGAADAATPSEQAEDGMDEFTRAYLDEQGAKMCDNCGAWIVREEGCDAVQCLCGFRFCWMCDCPGQDCSCRHAFRDFYDNILGGEIGDLCAEDDTDLDDHIVATAEEIGDLRSFIERCRARRNTKEEQEVCTAQHQEDREDEQPAAASTEEDTSLRAVIERHRSLAGHLS